MEAKGNFTALQRCWPSGASADHPHPPAQCCYTPPRQSPAEPQIGFACLRGDLQSFQLFFPGVGRSREVRAGEHLWQQGQLSAPVHCWRGQGSGWWGVVAALSPVPSAAGSAPTSVLSALHRSCSCHQGQPAVTQVDAPAVSSSPIVRRHLEQPVSKEEVS